MEFGALTISIWLTALQVDWAVIGSAHPAHLASEMLLKVQGIFFNSPPGQRWHKQRDCSCQKSSSRTWAGSEKGDRRKVRSCPNKSITLHVSSFLAWLDKMEEDQREVELKKLRFGKRSQSTPGPSCQVSNILQILQSTFIHIRNDKHFSCFPLSTLFTYLQDP